jgi:hypothetical protein
VYHPSLAGHHADVAADLEALKMVDEAYKDRTEWIKKSIRTVAKVRVSCCFTVCKISVLTNVLDGQVQLGPRDPGLRPGVLEHRVAEARVSRGV